MVFALAFVGIHRHHVEPGSDGLFSILLALNITLALLVLIIALYLNKPLEFSTFPSVLLILTFFRIALNVPPSTKLILTPGTEGTTKAGAVIEFFGNVVAGNNAIIGAVVFLILVVIQFVVITKGAGRIAEVAARFTLDAMPRQADGDRCGSERPVLIDEGQARNTPGKRIAREADFYGAMDGASKSLSGEML